MKTILSTLAALAVAAAIAGPVAAADAKSFFEQQDAARYNTDAGKFFGEQDRAHYNTDARSLFDGLTRDGR